MHTMTASMERSLGEMVDGWRLESVLNDTAHTLNTMIDTDSAILQVLDLQKNQFEVLDNKLTQLQADVNRLTLMTTKLYELRYNKAPPRSFIPPRRIA
jgi:hypothetical protein